MMHQKLVVIGGGAAGYFCAVTAARLNPNLEVVILERGAKVLQKVKVSGGGRCNVTHACFDIPEMASRYPRGERFVKKAFHQFFTSDTVRWFEERGVPLKTEADGRMFPQANDSQAVVDSLLQEAKRFDIKLLLNMPVTSVKPTEGGFLIDIREQQAIVSNYVVLACGGFQKLSQFDWLQNLNLPLQPPVPSLFTFNFPNHPLNKLMGLSVARARIKIAGLKLFSVGPLLITHWGLSGPAVLRLSAFAARHLAEMEYQFSISINWLPDSSDVAFLDKVRLLRIQSGNQKPVNGNFTGLPSRLWEYFLEVAGIDNLKRWADLTTGMVNKLAGSIFNCEMVAAGKTTFKEEFVTAGGVSLEVIDVNSMESKQHPGLHFAGEIMDVDGITGGYNFQHAWTSGFIAGKAIAAISIGKE